MLDFLQYYFWVLCNGMKRRFRMVMIAHPGPGIRFQKHFMWQIIIPPTPAPQVPRCTGSSVQPGSKHCRDDSSSSPEQSKELTLHQRLGPPVDIQASQPLRGGSLISWMTEQPPHMSRSSAHPGPPLLPLLPPRSHIPTCPHLPHPYLPSCCHSPSSCGYHCH